MACVGAGQVIYDLLDSNEVTKKGGRKETYCVFVGVLLKMKNFKERIELLVRSR